MTMKSNDSCRTNKATKEYIQNASFHIKEKKDAKICYLEEKYGERVSTSKEMKTPSQC
jgi:hypothetical protein